MLKNKVKTTYENLSLDSLKAYEKNMRIMTKTAIEGTKHSIEKYGYNVPIVIDEDNVIINGHTRLIALKELGAKTVTCQRHVGLSKKKTDQLRIADNKIAEQSSWDQSKLAGEVRLIKELTTVKEWESFGFFYGDHKSLDRFLNDSLGISTTDITKKMLKNKRIEQAGRIKNSDKNNTSFVKCPNCSRDILIKSYE